MTESDFVAFRSLSLTAAVCLFRFQEHCDQQAKRHHYRRRRHPRHCSERQFFFDCSCTYNWTGFYRAHSFVQGTVTFKDGLLFKKKKSQAIVSCMDNARAQTCFHVQHKHKWNGITLQKFKVLFFAKLCALKALFSFGNVFFSRWLAQLIIASSATSLKCPYKQGWLGMKTNRETNKVLKPKQVDRWDL